MTAVHIFASAMGHFGLLVENRTVWRLTFGRPTAAQALHHLRALMPPGISADPIDRTPGEMRTWIRETAQQFQQYAAGERVDLSAIAIKWDEATSFQRRVLEACRRIPYGCRATYGQLASQAGSPRAARAAGTVMAKNRLPLLIPCHRVVASAGGMGGYSGPRGVDMKRRLLAMEGAADTPSAPNRLVTLTAND